MSLLSTRRSLLNSGVPPWVLAGAQVDIDFKNNRAFARGAGLLPFSSLLSTTRAQSVSSYATDANGNLIAFAANLPRITSLGLLIEDARTNVVLWSRDLTNAAWTKSSITAALNQAGADGAANSATSLTATAGNGTVLQAITLGSSPRFQSAYVKRITGTGVINMTLDNGATWTPITVTSAFTQLSVPTQTLANPTVGFRIVTNGDAIAVDFVQNENGAFGTSPIPTTTASVARAVDNVTLSGSALSAALTAKSVFFQTNLISANSNRYWGDSASSQAFFNTPTDIRFQNASNFADAVPGTGTSAGVVKMAAGYSASSMSAVANNGTVGTNANGYSITGPLVFLGNRNALDHALDGYMQRFALWNVRLADTALKSLTQ